MSNVRFSTGRARPADCRCEYNFTCGVCLTAAHTRNKAEIEAAPPAWRRKYSSSEMAKLGNPFFANHPDFVRK